MAVAPANIENEIKKLEKKLALCALINTTEANSYAIQQVMEKRAVTQKPKMLLRSMEKCNDKFLQEFGKNTNKTANNFLEGKSSLVYEFALAVNTIPNEAIEQFSDAMEELVKKFQLPIG